MSLSRQSIEVLLDLVEIKLNAILVQDREDARELSKLRHCKQELLTISQLKNPSINKNLVNEVTSLA